MINKKMNFLILTCLFSQPLMAQQGNIPVHKTNCAACEEWNTPRRPFRIHGNAYYVGTDGLSSMLLTSSAGHVLIDGGLPESVPLIERNIRDLGFAVEDIKLIVNSHAHFDHAGGIASLQRTSGAEVAASPSSLVVLEQGKSEADDPQYGTLWPFPAVKQVRKIFDGETLKVGSIELTAHFTPGHTAGGTSWSWRSCEGEQCVDIVYADSLTPVSSEGFLFSRNEHYPSIVVDFERSFKVLESLPCDIVIAAHPFAVDLWQRLKSREQGKKDALIDSTGCGRYAAAARSKLELRLESEKEKSAQKEPEKVNQVYSH